MKVLFYDLKEPQRHDAYIDIFPLDGMPEGFLRNRIRQVKILFFRKLYALAIFDRGVGLHRANRTWYAKIGTAVCRVLPVQRLLSAQKRWNSMDRLLKKCGYDESPLLVDAMGGYKFKEMFLKEVFGDGALYEFEGMRLRGPQDYETYLTQLYGDYMTPPPESQRNWHNTEILEIEEERE